MPAVRPPSVRPASDLRLAAWPLPPEEPSDLEVRVFFRDRPLGVHHLAAGAGRPRPFVVGPARGADAPAPRELLDEDGHPLVRRVGDGFWVFPSREMAAELVHDRYDDGAAPAARQALPAGEPRPVEPGASLRLVCGAMTFQIARVAPPPRLPRARAAWGPRERRAFGLVALAALAFGLVVAALPRDPALIGLEPLPGLARRFDRVIPTVPPPAPRAPGRAGAGGGGGGGAGAGANVGAPAPARAARPPRGRARPTSPSSAVVAREAVARAGLLGVIARLEETGAAAAIFSGGPTGLDGGDDLLAGLARGDAAGSFGAGGPGIVGTGHGGAGAGLGTVGLGPLGTIGRGGRPGGGPGYGRSAGGLGPRPRAVIRIETRDPVVRGSLDKELVRRQIRRHLNEVRYCYERELPRCPDLAGRIVTRFVIGPGGDVLSAAIEASPLGDAAVVACVAEAVRRWQFPQPAGAGAVIVSYPFVFTTAGP